MTERQVERWLRLRRAQDKPSTLTKFCENTWRCMYYMYSFLFGLIVLWDKVWFWDIKHCWYGYPHQVPITLFFSFPFEMYYYLLFYAFTVKLILFLVSFEWYLVVLYDIDGVLLVTDGYPIYWCKTQGLLANVYSSHGNAFVNVLKLGVQFASSWISGPSCSWLCGHFFRSKSILYINFIFMIRFDLMIYHNIIYRLPSWLNTPIIRSYVILYLPFSRSSG